jgi:hypothetical protein
MGNSVHAFGAEHSFADRRHRDEHLRRYAQDFGLGLPLYISSTLDRRSALAEERLHTEVSALTERLERMESSLRAIERHLDRSVDTRVRAWAWSWKQRLRRR